MEDRINRGGTTPRNRGDSTASASREETVAVMERLKGDSGIAEGRQRAMSDKRDQQREQRLESMIGKPSTATASSNAEKAASDMKIAQKLRAEGNLLEADLMQEMAMEQDAGAAMRARAESTGVDTSTSLSSEAKRRMDTTAEGRANFEGFLGELQKDGNAKIIQEGRRRADSVEASQENERQKARLDSLIGKPSTKKPKVEFETEQERNAWSNMELAAKLRSKGKHGDADTLEMMAESEHPATVAKFRAEQ